MEKINDHTSTSSDDVVEKCSTWLESCSLDDSFETNSCCSEFSSSSNLTYSSNSTQNSAMQSGFKFLTSEPTIGNITIDKHDQQSQMTHLSSLIGRDKIPENSKIQIYKSKKVHIGDVNFIQGPIYVNKITQKYSETENIIDNSSSLSTPVTLFITERRSWLAQPPLERNPMKEPAKHVIICHSATEGANTIAENILLVRLIQSFHMDSRKWSDIGYNFLIGDDGSVFEGRGWNLVGAHTRQYNSVSLGICFIGTFSRHKPSQNAMTNAKKLIEHGVSIGAISQDYSLLGHCQCIGTESPGEALFMEIKTWKNFDATVGLRNPSIALPSLKNVDEIFVP
ncbi:peptidoglycan-recognition protein LE-like [Coccinella septempunctata]|uniref:peptidoglycan-recognition protein LE-like n=1 Tax=Coccinella septempunctata TaxID=41139 RepID=UPI001D0679D6|nr:peptidoglycan-recognition protein LE-like [Coccinella septempunctata]